MCHLLAIGTPLDDVESIALLRIAAEAGIAAAQYEMGFAYYYGHGVLRDDHEGLKWWQLAAERGDADACCAFSMRPIDGSSYLDETVCQGHADAMYRQCGIAF